ncbi:MAG: aminoglycoside phosphotransferase family protein [Saprospiraceae bacterium]|nr:aminoglycoside phosphotransferase family protein [Saprospiraceae bacterium]MDG2419629.1 aminoglycoside phosphotransferase family protein [Saprospiraceae bacterium]
MNEVKSSILYSFFKNIDECKVIPYGSGLIHQTFYLHQPEGNYILQKVNHHVFKNPIDLANNIEVVSNHLKQNHYPKSVLNIRKCLNGNLMLQTTKNEYWRVFDFIEDTQYFSKPESKKQIYQTGKSFGEFLAFLKNLPIKKINPSIPNFHNTRLRFQNFEKAIQNDKSNRVKTSSQEIEQIKKWHFILKDFEKLDTPIRVVHADPKISNLLFDHNKKVKAVIDWDTIMPGFLLHDFGDLVRTGACEEDEESTNFGKIKISPSYYGILKKGFLESTKLWLTKVEEDNLLLGAKIIIYEQAIRFLTDYLEGDQYYKTSYTNQNINRTKNQIELLNSIL